MPAETSPILEKPYKTPKITGPLSGGKTLKNADFKGKWTILYFYPKDLTPGCTTESQEFQAKKRSFSALGAQIVGVSKDSLSRHDRFAEKLGLSFPLISDEEGTLCEDFEVWKEKKMYGKTFMGIERSTFLIDPQLKVVAEWRKVKVNGHVAEVLATLKELVP